jgi:thiol-disulfide isomerase/thioredoxin
MLVFLFVLFSFSHLYAQYKQVDSCADFTLFIGARNHPTDTVKLLYYDCETAYDHESLISLSNGKATLSGKVNRATEAIFFVDPKYRMLDGRSVIRFIIEPGTITLNFTADSGKAKDIVIKGSFSEKQKEQWDKENAALFAAEDNLLYNQWHAIDKEKGTKDSMWAKKRRAQISDSIGLVRKAKANQALAFAKAKPGSFFSAYLLNHYKRVLPLDSLTKYYSLLSPTVRQSDFGKNLLKEIFTLTDDLSFREKYADSNFFKTLKNINTLYEIALTNTEGGKTSFSQYRGKYLLLDFWGSWCGPCFKNEPYLKQLMTELKDQPIEFIPYPWIRTKAPGWPR